MSYISSEYNKSARVILSHTDKGVIGEGTLKFGYACFANFIFDDLKLLDDLNEDQLKYGLFAISSSGEKFNLLNCEKSGAAIYADFVVVGKEQAASFDRFQVRYSNVSEWFSQQMQICGQLGEALEWKMMPVPLAADVSLGSRNFKIESIYIANINQSGEDRIFHQHFEFLFTAIDDPFSPREIENLTYQLSHLFSILLAHQCTVETVNVASKSGRFGRIYYGIHELKLMNNQNSEEKISLYKYFTFKKDVDNCWEHIINKFFNSNYREVIWSRLAGIGNYVGFWEYQVLGCVSILDRYVSQRFDKLTISKKSSVKKSEQFRNQLRKMNLSLSDAQEADLMSAVNEIFSYPLRIDFQRKFKALMDELDADVKKIINLTSMDFRLIKELRDEVAHGRGITFPGKNLTLIFTVVDRITILLMYIFFMDVGLGRDVFLRNLSKSVTSLRRNAKLDEVHLDRVLNPEKFIPVSAGEFIKIKNRSRGLLNYCFERNSENIVTYSEKYSLALENQTRKGYGGYIYKFLGLPEKAVCNLSKAYFENEEQIESVYSVVIIDMAHISDGADE